MTAFPFIGGSSEARSKSFDGQRCINLFLELGGEGAKNRACLIGTPGKRLLIHINDKPVRGFLKFNRNTIIVVTGNEVHKLTAVNVNAPIIDTLIGTISSFSGLVQMDSNGTQVMLVTGTIDKYTIVPLLNIITLIDDPVSADSVGFINGRFIFNESNSGRYRITAAFDTTIDPLKFATAEGSPDLLLSLIPDHKEIWLFGETSIEVHGAVNNIDFPFQLIDGAFIEQGTAAKFSPAKADNSLFWLGADRNGNGIVYRANGYTPVRVSDHALEVAIAKYDNIEDAIGWAHQTEGHIFYVLTFPSGNQTWVYDVASKRWHQRAYLNPFTGLLERDRANCHVTWFGRSIVGDYATGNIYHLDLDYFLDHQNLIPRIRRCQHDSTEDYQRQFFASLQIDMEVGVGVSDLGDLVISDIPITGGASGGGYIPAPIPNITLVYDDFIGASGSIEGRVANSGQTWVDFFSDDAKVPRLNGAGYVHQGTLDNTAAQAYIDFAVTNELTGPFYLEIQYPDEPTIVPSGGGGEGQNGVRIFFTNQALANTFSISVNAFSFNNTLDQFRVLSRVNDIAVSTDITPGAYNPAPYIMRLVCDPGANTAKIYINGIQVGATRTMEGYVPFTNQTCRFFLHIEYIDVDGNVIDFRTRVNSVLLVAGVPPP